MLEVEVVDVLEHGLPDELPSFVGETSLLLIKIAEKAV